MDIPAIIDKAGGAATIAAKIGKTPDAVRKWPRIGIPDRHWPLLIQMSGHAFGPQELYAANIAARAEQDSAAA